MLDWERRIKRRWTVRGTGRQSKEVGPDVGFGVIGRRILFISEQGWNFQTSCEEEE